MPPGQAGRCRLYRSAPSLPPLPRRVFFLSEPLSLSASAELHQFSFSLVLWLWEVSFADGTLQERSLNDFACVGPASTASDNRRQPPAGPVLVIGSLLGPPLLLLHLVSCPSGSAKGTCVPSTARVTVLPAVCLHPQLPLGHLSDASDASSRGYWSLLDSHHQPSFPQLTTFKRSLPSRPSFGMDLT